jgi:hypothetical protein
MLTTNKSLLSKDSSLDEPASQSAEPRRILCYGDSLTAGLCNNCGHDYYSYSSVLEEKLGCKLVLHPIFGCSIEMFEILAFHRAFRLEYRADGTID